MEHSAAGRRRSPRDWLVDLCLFLLAAAYWMAADHAEVPFVSGPGWLPEADQVVGALGCAALWTRRRWPVGLALVLVAASAAFELVAGAMLVALFSVAMYRPPRTTVIVFVMSLLAAFVYVFLRPQPVGSEVMLGVALQGAVVGWGLFIRHRRQLLLSLRERAARAEEEARLRAEQAQHQARDAIAREIHDVLGHRLSLLSVHAGALEYRPDASGAEIAHSVAVIRETAHRALQDLREVVGVLRAPVGELPQPTVADLRDLVGESATAGMRVDLLDELAAEVPEQPGRAAYRIVQEALTNARKHAPGAEVRVRLAGGPGRGLTVEVDNTAPVAAPASVPGARSGQGLVGVTERLAVLDGRLEHGPTAAGGWRLSAWIPWPA